MTQPLASNSHALSYLHLKVLITLLVTLGVLITAYQIFVLGIPVTEDETDDLWNIDAKVEFQATPREPVKLADVHPAAEPGLRQPQRELHLQQLRRERQPCGRQPPRHLVGPSRQRQAEPSTTAWF